MMPAATVSLVVPSITSNVYAMYILSNHYLCVYLFLLLLLLFLVCFTYLPLLLNGFMYILQSCLFLPDTNFSIHCLDNKELSYLILRDQKQTKSEGGGTYILELAKRPTTNNQHR